MANNFDPAKARRGQGARVSKSRSDVPMWKQGGTYLFIAQLALGFIMYCGGWALADTNTAKDATVLSTLCMLLAAAGLVGIAWEFEPVMNMHVIGSMVCLSMLISSGWQGQRNVRTMCALAKLERWDEYLHNVATKDGIRQQAAFNTMALRLSAMDMVVEDIHDDPEMGGLMTMQNEPPKRTGKAFQELYFRNVWRVTDTNFIVMKLERLKRSTLKFLDTLDEDATGMDPQAVYEAKTTIRELVEDTTNLAEEIISRDRDAGVSPEEYDEAVTEIKWAFQNVTSLLMTAQAAAKGSDGGQHPEQNAARSELKKAMGSMKVTKEALMRLKNDHYESMKLPHLQTVKENWRGRWALALASKINKTELEERAYLGDVTKWCHGEMELQRVYRMCSFAMFWILAASAYVTFSRSFLVAARKQGGSHVHRCASANASG